MDVDRDLKSLKCIVFDFDGTLFHLDVDWARVRRDLAIDATGEPAGAAIQRLLLADDPRLALVTDAEVAGVGQRRLSASVVETLRTLDERHRLAILTRNSRTAVERAMEGTGLDGILVVGREDCRLQKPDPAGLTIILEQLGLAPDQALMVGDTYHDVDAARAAGVPCVVVRNDRLAVAPAADRTIDRVEDLLNMLGER